MTLYTNFPYPIEIQDVVKLFFPDSIMSETDGADIIFTYEKNLTTFVFHAKFNIFTETNFVDTADLNDLQSVRMQKRYAKVCMYNCLVKATGKLMPWGSLTGIRPTRLARQVIGEGIEWKNYFKTFLCATDSKIKLVDDILTAQDGLYGYKQGTADLYVGIPFCVTRCSYCSFTSGELDKLKKYVEPYVDTLCDDIRQTLHFVKQNGITIRNVYFGGGTPTSLTTKQLERVINEITVKPIEFTVEAGRPDTIDREKLEMLKNHGVTRVSINPQTFNQSVLDVVGRKHSVQDIYDKYYIAKELGFVVNMDLIAGLPTETYEMFCHSIDSAIALSPDNITVHTLALKNGSVLKLNNYTEEEAIVGKMVEYAHQKLYEADYTPYYMYRQKYVCENLENVGFCKKGTECLYNIDIMEEVADIIACGTNAISKKISIDENRIERSANAKDVISYINNNQIYLDRKFELFKVK